MKKIFFILCTIATSIIYSCTEKYEPLTVAGDNRYLVVEGFLNAGADTTTIKLTRTISLNDTAQEQPELNAVVTVESGGQIFNLNESGKGLYRIATLPLQTGSECRLHIRTASGKEYLSDAVPVLATPPIDSINWVQSAEGVNIYANTHDPQNNTRYYRWDFTETWQIRSPFFSNIEYKNGGLVLRDFNINIFNCWKTVESTSLLLGSSVRLTDDIIKDQPMIFIEDDSWKIAVKYSIIVRQNSLTKQGYEYLTNMKKNSEQLGTIFDPMPSQIPGNIKCISNPQELVIGYVCAGTSDERRIFIDNKDLYQWNPRSTCEEKLVPPDSIDFYFGGFILTPTTSALPMGVYGSSESCVDCRTKGSNVKPPFWP